MHLATRPTRDVPWLRVLDIPTASTRRTLSHILDAESLGKTSSQGYGPVPVGVWSQDSWTGSPRFGLQLHRGKGGGRRNGETHYELIQNGRGTPDVPQTGNARACPTLSIGGIPPCGAECRVDASIHTMSYHHGPVAPHDPSRLKSIFGGDGPSHSPRGSESSSLFVRLGWVEDSVRDCAPAARKDAQPRSLYPQ